MTREDIVRMAREADDFADSYTPQYVTLPHEWQEIRDKRFASLVASLVAAAEREACARIVENEAMTYSEPTWAVEIVNDIRARSQV